MADRLNMSLDDMIDDRRSNSGASKHSNSRRTHRNRSPERSRHRSDRDSSYRSSSYAPYRRRSPSRATEPVSNIADCKLTVRNLSYEADETDLRNIFGRIARIKRIFIDYDKSGRSNGVAEITYFDEKDAEEACKSFNGAKLDGQEMSITKEPFKRKRSGDEDFERLLLETGWKKPEYRSKAN